MATADVSVDRSAQRHNYYYLKPALATPYHYHYETVVAGNTITILLHRGR